MSLKRRANQRLVRKYSEWLVCQRYSRTARETYNRVAGKFFRFWGRRHFSKVSPLDIHDSEMREPKLAIRQQRHVQDAFRSVGNNVEGCFCATIRRKKG
jgi:hypothetical protein